MNFHSNEFQPEELAELKAIFDDITSQPWFRADAKDDFARHIFETFPSTGYSPHKRRSTIEASARMFYSRES